MNGEKRFAAAVCVFLAGVIGPYSIAAQGDGEAPVVTLQSTVSGTQDQPRVMYIVPWQEPGAAEFDYALDNRLVQEVFAPIDRDEFIRELNYREKIRGIAGSTAAQAKTN